MVNSRKVKKVSQGLVIGLGAYKKKKKKKPASGSGSGLLLISGKKVCQTMPKTKQNHQILSISGQMFSNFLQFVTHFYILRGAVCRIYPHCFYEKLYVQAFIRNPPQDSLGKAWKPRIVNENKQNKK